MNSLAAFCDLEIDWTLTPEDAVMMFMEQDETGGALPLPPVHNTDAEACYFVVDAWDSPPTVRLLRRNYTHLKELACVPLPDALRPCLREEIGNEKGVFAPPAAVLAWLKECVNPSGGEADNETASDPSNADALRENPLGGAAGLLLGGDPLNVFGASGLDKLGDYDLPDAVCRDDSSEDCGEDGECRLGKDEERLLSAFFSQKSDDLFGGSSEIRFLEAIAKMQAAEQEESEKK